MQESIFKNNLLEGQKVVVTGGGSGIGFAIAKYLGSLGACVILAARDVGRLEQSVDRLQNEGIKADLAFVNIRDEKTVTELFNQLDLKYGAIEALINNAGGQFAASALDMSANGFRSVVDLNLQGTFHMCQAYAKHCIRHNKEASIVNMVLCLEQGIPGMAHAAAARAGVINLTKSLAWEWADYGIRINAIAPGTINTEALQQYDQTQLQKTIATLPIKRMGSPSEIAATVAFLLSPAATYITGICLAQDGGEHLTGASPQQ